MNNPYSGRVPLNLIRDKEEVVKSTSFRPGVSHKLPVRNQHDDLGRNPGITYARRYPNGKLDIKYVASKVIDTIHKVQNMGKLTGDEKALLTLTLPGIFPLMDEKIAGTMFRMTDSERMLVAIAVKQHMNEELNFNAGRGGGSVPNRHVTRS